MLLAVSALFAATSKGPDEARALIEKGRAVSDIWAEGNPPFRLEARFQLLSSQQLVEGTYVQIWAPPGSSREEIVLPGYQELVVRNGNKAYYTPAPESEAFAAFLVRRIVNLRSHFTVRPTWKIKGVKVRKEQGTQVKCASAGNQVEGFNELCLDPATEYVLFEYGPTMAFSYSGYSKFGSRLFPSVFVAKLGGPWRMEVVIEKLVEDSSSDTTLFEPPPGAQASAWCEDPTPARMIRVEPTRAPGRGMRELNYLQAWAVVGKDGRLHNPVVQHSSRGPVNMTALENELGGWRFQPAACEGSPVETWISLTTEVAQ
jgi:hypothetical protein